jgi:hypothetical protein
VVWTVLTVVLVVGALVVVSGLLPGVMGGRAGVGPFRRPPGLPKKDGDGDREPNGSDNTS